MVDIINKNNNSPSVKIKDGCFIFIDGGAPPINPTKKAHRDKISKAYKSYNKNIPKFKKKNNNDNTTIYYLNKEDFSNFFTNKYLNNNFNTPLLIEVN